MELTITTSPVLCGYAWDRGVMVALDEELTLEYT